MPQLNELVSLWNQAKADEQSANARRLAVEILIVDMMPGYNDQESTVKEDVGRYRVKVARKVTRSVDTDELQTIWQSLTTKAQACFAWKASVKVGELRKVQEFLPDDYAKLAKIIETKPAKPSVTVEPLEMAEAA